MSIGVESTSTLILRAWLERGPPPSLRVRITQIEGDQELASTTTVTVDGACALVRAWLTEVLHRSAS